MLLDTIVLSIKSEKSAETLLVLAMTWRTRWYKRVHTGQNRYYHRNNEFCPQGVCTDNKTRLIDKIYARVKLTGSHDTGSDTCTLTSTDLQKSQLAVKIKSSNCVLNKYGGGTIEHYGTTRLKVSYLNKPIVADFKIVEAPKNSSILGCRLELGLTLNFNNIQSVRETNQQSKLIEVARQGTLTNYKSKRIASTI